MKQSKSYIRTFTGFCCGLVIMSSANLQLGLAATETNTTFVAHYEHREQVAAELMAIAQPVPSSKVTGTGEIKSTVTKVNQEIASLYTEDQALAEQTGTNNPEGTGGTTNTVPMRPSAIAMNVRALLRDTKAGVAEEVKAYTHAIQHPGTHGKAWSKRLSAQVKQARMSAASVAKTTQAVNLIIGRSSFRKSLSLQMDALQSAIEQAQAGVIEMLNAWLWLGDPAWETEQPIAVTSLAYVDASITAPAKRQPPVTDAVGIQPQVMDAAGQPLPDMGTYSLEGPVGYVGVEIDPLVGTITVHPRASLGTYSIIYKQGSAVERISFRVMASGSNRS